MTQHTYASSGLAESLAKALSEVPALSAQLREGFADVLDETVREVSAESASQKAVVYGSLACYRRLDNLQEFWIANPLVVMQSHNLQGEMMHVRAFHPKEEPKPLKKAKLGK